MSNARRDARRLRPEPQAVDTGLPMFVDDYVTRRDAQRIMLSEKFYADSAEGRLAELEQRVKVVAFERRANAAKAAGVAVPHTEPEFSSEEARNELVFSFAWSAEHYAETAPR